LTAGGGSAPLGDLERRLRDSGFLDSLAALDEADLEAARDVLELVADALLEGALQVLQDWAVAGAPGGYVFRLPSGRFVAVDVTGEPGAEVAAFGPVEEPSEVP
jgi:hypothetical protein